MAVLQNESGEGHQAARQELYRMAELADLYNESLKAKAVVLKAYESMTFRVSTPEEIEIAKMTYEDEASLILHYYTAERKADKAKLYFVKIGGSYFLILGNEDYLKPNMEDLVKPLEQGFIDFA